jgi:hypothetical protein
MATISLSVNERERARQIISNLELLLHLWVASHGGSQLIMIARGSHPAVVDSNPRPCTCFHLRFRSSLYEMNYMGAHWEIHGHMSVRMFHLPDY